MSIEIQIFTYVVFVRVGTYTEFTSHSGQDLKKAGHASMMSAEKVVAIGMKAMFRRRMTIVTGFINFLACHVGEYFPASCLMGRHQAMKNSVSYSKK